MVCISTFVLSSLLHLINVEEIIMPKVTIVSGQI